MTRKWKIVSIVVSIIAGASLGMYTNMVRSGLECVKTTITSYSESNQLQSAHNRITEEIAKEEKHLLQQELSYKKFSQKVEENIAKLRDMTIKHKNGVEVTKLFIRQSNTLHNDAETMSFAGKSFNKDSAETQKIAFTRELVTLKEQITTLEAHIKLEQEFQKKWQKAILDGRYELEILRGKSSEVLQRIASLNMEKELEEKGIQRHDITSFEEYLSNINSILDKRSAPNTPVTDIPANIEQPLTLEQIATMIQEQNRPVQKPDVVVTLDAATKLLYELENETKEKVESSNQPSNMESQNTPEESSEKANE